MDITHIISISWVWYILLLQYNCFLLWSILPNICLGFLFLFFFFLIYPVKILMYVVLQSLSRVQHFATPWSATHQTSLSSLSPGVCSNSCPLSWRCHSTIPSSVTLFLCLQVFPESGSFPTRLLFTSDGQSIVASALVSVLPMNIQG